MIVFHRTFLVLLFASFFIIGWAQSYDSLKLKMDSIVAKAIKSESFPGCVIYASQKDSVLFFQAYGHHTYDSLRNTHIDDIYDLASITKVTGATLALMKLYEEGKINLDAPLQKYISGLGRRVSKVTIRECLAHQAGLRPWIPYYQQVRRKNGTYKRNTVGRKRKDFNYALTDSLFLHDDFYRKIKKMIKKSSVSKEKKYNYSGLFFYLVPELVERQSGRKLDDFLDMHFFNPLGSSTLLFNPLERFAQYQIVPTENDTYFRMEQIHGKVHDEGAITMKGVSGNAGLFSNAKDLAKVWYMLLNDGVYDSITYLKPTTIQLFTTTQYPNNKNRRALGFDKPMLQYNFTKSSIARSASFRSYGHSGFTGTLVWADPDNGLLFIFLANRVYPTRENKNIYHENVRPAIHQLFYDYIGK